MSAHLATTHPTPAEPALLGLTADSRAVRPGYLFAALTGKARDGRSYIQDAVRRGASAVLLAPGPHRQDLPPHVALIEDANPRRRLALLAAAFYGHQPRRIAAVTGTSGKTSVVTFARRLWEALGCPAASLGTLGAVGPGFQRDGALTTPDPVALHRDLARLAAHGIDHVAIEASSHGLDQCRLDAVTLAAAAFTGLGRDHLDYHTDADAYLAAKLRLFHTVMAPGGIALLNADNVAVAGAADLCRRAGHQVWSYGWKGAELRLEALLPDADGQVMSATLFGHRRQVRLPLLGVFQAQNALAAVGIVAATGGSIDDAFAQVEMLSGVRGRLELVGRLTNGAAVFVDYAHKPDALAAVLETLRPHCRGRLIALFGCGGDRDQGKRPMMGEIARRLADQVIVTDDNPRGEDPAVIRAAIRAACPEAEEIADRATAIEDAVARLRLGDILLIAGKGHEQGQIIGAKTRPFDDATEARAAIQRVDAAIRAEDRGP
ncbi:MAG: UDP-N-acetylmuramoyl-L-alanyl-D-glutamate--2,6-diaminopimelate ligase [Alphaproteobacteria bacterium]|nr:UDP-N-acetylmuramoyl-L-alanyl-D-glutamate--2,6-diaminopimelate ligase [Alphaproteobacteria bacterium]